MMERDVWPGWYFLRGFSLRLLAGLVGAAIGVIISVWIRRNPFDFDSLLWFAIILSFYSFFCVIGGLNDATNKEMMPLQKPRAKDVVIAVVFIVSVVVANMHH